MTYPIKKISSRSSKTVYIRWQSSQTVYQQHKPSGYFIATIRFDGKNKHAQYTGHNTADEFTEKY